MCVFKAAQECEHIVLTTLPCVCVCVCVCVCACACVCVQVTTGVTKVHPVTQCLKPV